MRLKGRIAVGTGGASGMGRGAALKLAGILSGRTPWHSLSREEMNRFLQINFMGYFLSAKAMYPLLRKSKAGRVINVASRTFFLANPG
jgi:3-oxoacyl-[acyl-carrier protein] reductase